MKLVLALLLSLLVAPFVTAQTVVDGALTSVCSGAVMTLDPNYPQNVCTVTQAITTINVPSGVGGARPFLLKIVNPSNFAISGWPSTVQSPIQLMPGINYLRGVWDSSIAQWVFLSIGNQLFYGSSGLLSGGKCWTGTVTSNTSGAAVVNYSTAGFSNPPFLFVQSYAQSTAAGGQYWANPVQSTITTTGASIAVTTPATLIALGITIQLGSVSIPIAVLACGN